MVAILDYGVGNLFSLSSSLRFLGFECVITRDPAVIRCADRMILPGVGAFGDAVEKLKKDNMDQLIRREAQNGKPLLGICLGMQLLFEKSYEFGTFESLKLLKGEIVPMKGRIDPQLKIPHIGWNALHFTRENPLFRYNQEGDFVYFVHSFYADHCEDSLIATTDYGISLTAANACGNIYGCQFHPEKSGETGLRILQAFCETEAAMS